MNKLFKCNDCLAIFELIFDDGSSPYCCNGKMEPVAEKKEDQGYEKHLPAIEAVDGKLIVRVGSVSHPMLDEHYIMWIEISGDGFLHRKYLKPGDAPEAEFLGVSGFVKARAFCNIHGLWALDFRI